MAAPDPSADMLFRSENMQYVRLTMASDTASDTMRELAKVGKLHLVDMNGDDAVITEGYLYYKRRVVECDQWLRKILWFRSEMTRCNVEQPGLEVPAREDFLPHGTDVVAAAGDYLLPLEEELNRNNEFRVEQGRALNSLEEQIITLKNLRGKVSVQVSADPVRMRSGSDGMGLEMHGNDLSRPLIDEDEVLHHSERGAHKPDDQRFHSYASGILPLSVQGVFERMLFRLSRGNAYVRFVPLAEPVVDHVTGERTLKAVFNVVYIGTALRSRVEKMCETFRATRVDVPEREADVDRMVAVLEQQAREKLDVLARTQHNVESLLRGMASEAGGSPVRDWEEALRSEMVICDGLKKARTPAGTSLFTVEGWVPSQDVDEVALAVRTATRHSGAQPAVMQTLDLGHDVMPPTYFRTNKYTSVFQSIVNTYGVPRYKEVNPGLFTIVTFPFLFGIMYGDMFHGTFLTLFGLGLIIKENALGKLKAQGKLGELPGMAYGGRYLLFAMGLCAVYAGTLYNDCASVPINAFGSRWHYRSNNGSTDDGPNSAVTFGLVYPYGVDPTWYNTKNELTFFNSMKMKMAVTFGVVQMTFGIFLSLLNHLHAGDSISIFFEFIPQLLFMLCTFGYMIFLIIYKFTVNWNSPSLSAKVAPNLIQTMIAMFLSPGSVPKAEVMYPGQGLIQAILVLIAVFSIPTMLIPKPYLLRAKWRREHPGWEQKAAAAAAAAAAGGGGGGAGSGAVLAKHSSSVSGADGDEHKEDDHHSESGSLSGDALSRARALACGSGGGDHHGDGDEFHFSDIFIHQAIHTIEFVLGCVSNTASYLRLWALSLAHSELSNVFWEKLIMEYGISNGSPIFAFVGWGAWAGATFAVLLCMDTLEAFLHALRLHWVEFQSKFFKADGYAFTAFSFDRVED